MQDVIQGFGAVAGLASILGLAVLAALYVAQARDVRRLREWAGGAPERSAEGVTAVLPASISRPAALRVVPEPAAIAPPRRSAPQRGRVGERRVAVALVGLLLVVGGATVYGVVHVIGGDGGHPSAKAPVDHGDRRSGAGAARRTRAVVEPGTVTVAVLNGTTVPGLAAMLRDRIGAAGFAKGTINDYSGPPVGASVVQYAPGHEAEAEAVGRRLGIRQRAPITAESRALAADATVIVIAGADQAP